MIWIMFICFFLLLILGMPIAFSLGISGAIYLITGDSGVNIISFFPQRLFRAMDLYPLLAIPLFVLAGELMSISIISRLIDFSKSIMGSLKGNLAFVTIFACLLFGGITGISIAATVAIGTLMIPSMVKEGYDRAHSASIIAASSTLGTIIPPSIPMIVYALAVSGTSIADMFLGGIGPGVLLALLFMVVARFILRKNELVVSGEPFNFRKFLSSLRNSIWAIFMPIIIIGGIVGGIFTPTEAAAVAVAYALFVGFVINRDLKLSHLPKFMIRSGVITSVVLFLMGMASIVSWIITINNLHISLSTYITSLTSNPIIFIFIVVVLLLILGMFLDASPIIIMIAPILAPIAMQFGIDPIHFGVIFVITLVMGMITPPVGIILFVASSVSKESFPKITKNTLPYLGTAIIMIIIIVLIPQVVLFIPSLFG